MNADECGSERRTRNRLAGLNICVHPRSSAAPFPQRRGGTPLVLDPSPRPSPRGWHLLARFGAYRCALAQEAFRGVRVVGWRDDPDIALDVWVTQEQEEFPERACRLSPLVALQSRRSKQRLGHPAPTLLKDAGFWSLERLRHTNLYGKPLVPASSGHPKRCPGHLSPRVTPATGRITSPNCSTRPRIPDKMSW